MPFGLCNAPGTFQGPMDIILSPVKGQFVLIYLDGTIIISQIADGCTEHFQTVLFMLPWAGVMLNLMKCKFFTEKTCYLEHVVCPGRLELASHTTAAIRKVKPPRTLMELKSLWGLCNLYCRIVFNFAKTAFPLSPRLGKRKNKQFHNLSTEEMFALMAQQQNFIAAQVVASPGGEG